MDQDQIQQKEKLSTLNGDILLAEKTLRRIQDDIINHAKSKGDSFREYDLQIKLKQDEVTALQNEGDRLRQLILLETASYEAIKNDKMEQSKKWVQDALDAEEAVKSIYANANDRIKAVADREANCFEKEEKILADEEKIAKEWADIKNQRDQLDNQTLVIERARKDANDEITTKRILLAEATQKLDDITRQIPIQTDILEKIKREIEENTGKATAIIEDANEKNRKANDRSLILTMRDKKQNEREDLQNKKEIWLDDRERTIGRAYKEVIQRGGTIDPSI